MATLKPCKRCSEQVSIWDRNCPHCGISSPTASAKQMVGGLIALLVLGGIFAMIFSDSDGSTVTGAKETSIASTKRALNVGGENNIISNTIGCIDKDDNGSIASYSDEGDKDAAYKLFLEKADVGKCTLLYKNEIVFVEDTSWDMAQVRRKGKTTKYWINSSHIEGVPKPLKTAP